jgi:hypothetical protein
VADLVATPSQVYTFWRVSPVESVIWWAAVLVTIFTSIEIGIYTSIISSLVVLVFRIMVPRGAFLGRVTVQSGDAEFREVFVPLQKKGAINSQIQVSAPYPGVVIYRYVVYRFMRGIVDPRQQTRRGPLVSKFIRVQPHSRGLHQVTYASREGYANRASAGSTLE